MPEWGTAVHEAGHAVIGRVLKMLCGHATIVPDVDSTGHSITADPWVIWEYWLDEVGIQRPIAMVFHFRMMTFMAGAEAERVVLGSCRGGDEDDCKQVTYMADDLIDTFDPAWGRWERRLRRHTARLVRKHRATIELVARALMSGRTLSGEEIDRLCGR